MNGRRLLLVVAFFLACACKGEATSGPPPQPMQNIPPTVSSDRRTPIVVAVHNVISAVVNIQTESLIRQRGLDPFFGFFGQDRTFKTQSVGSGFVWNQDGIIVTNAHVVEGASSIICNFSDGSQRPAKVLGVDPDNDLAVLRVDARNLPAARLGTSSDLLIGETVIAVGNPFGLGGTVTTGIVSATGRSVPSKEHGRTYTDFIQTDASINPGNSGGPLLNIEGKVIGINVAIYADAQGIGFAIPVDRARKIVEDLRAYGEVHRAWIGAVTATITPEDAHRRGSGAVRGARVTRIFSSSPAERAGLRVGDVIVGIGGAPVESRESFTTLTETMPAGRTAALRVQRGNRIVEVPLQPINPPRNLGLRVLEEVSGVRVQEEDSTLVISRVAAGSRAASIGLARGDVIVGVNGVETRSLQTLNEQLARSADRSSIVLSIARGRYIYTLTFPLGESGGVEEV